MVDRRSHQLLDGDHRGLGRGRRRSAAVAPHPWLLALLRRAQGSANAGTQAVCRRTPSSGLGAEGSQEHSSLGGQLRNGSASIAGKAHRGLCAHPASPAVTCHADRRRRDTQARCGPRLHRSPQDGRHGSVHVEERPSNSARQRHHQGLYNSLVTTAPMTPVTLGYDAGVPASHPLIGSHRWPRMPG
jgi:hypothetical protein